MIKSRRMRWTGHVAHKWKMAYKMLVRRPDRKRPFRRPRHR